MSAGPATLVTGGAGFAGATLVRDLLDEGARVQVLDNWFTGRASHLPDHPGLEVVDADIRDSARLAAELRRLRPQRVVHLAAIHFIPYCNAHPEECWDVNTVGTLRLFEALSGLPVERVVIASSAAVYPIQDEPCREDGAVGPSDVYGASKLACEALGHRLAAEQGVSVACARLFNIFGPGETNPHIIPAILEQLHEEGPLRLGNLSARRDYVHVSDVSSALRALLAGTEPGCEAYNVGTGAAFSVSDILDILADELGHPMKVEVDQARTRRIDRPTLLADPSKLEARFGWEARMSLRDGLRDLLGRLPATSS